MVNHDHVSYEFYTMQNITDNMASHQRESTIVPDQTRTFPLNSLTTEHRNVFKKFLTIRREDWLNIHEPVWLALLLIGERPACKISPVETHPDMDLPELSVEEIVSVFDLYGCEWRNEQWVVAQTSSRMDMLPSESNSDEYHRRLGHFFGYPEDDIDAFLRADSPGKQWDNTVRTVDVSIEELAYTTFVPQKPAPSVEGCERAIRSGKENRKTISEYSEKWDLKALNAYSDWLYYDILTKLSL